MIRLVDSEGAKKLDEDARKLGMPGMVLMERAALSVAEFIRDKLLRDDEDKKIIAVCGSGNNGGDGIACARILHEWGYNSEVIMVGKKEKFTNQTKLQIRLAKNSGVAVKIANPAKLITEKSEFNQAIVIDAVFGVGFKGKLDGDLAKFTEYINMFDSVKVAVDIPSGVNGSNGKVEGVAVKCDYTITFGVNKLGIAVYPGKDYAGEIVVADIGFPKKAMEMVSPDTFTFDESQISYYMPERKEYSNKGDFGKILIIAGSEEMCGASFLSALAAYRTGGGLVRLFVPEANRQSLQNLLPEAILTTYEDSADKAISKVTADKLEKAVKEWAAAIVIGPGLGLTKRSKSLVAKTLEISEVRTVIDADGLTLFREIVEKREKRNFNPVKDMKKNYILTPHIKELADLLYLPKEEVKENIVQIAKELKGCNGEIVIKEARTLVTGGGKCYINNSGNSGLAKAGSGDVLTGILAALIATEKQRPFMVTPLGVYIHGLAGDMLKEKKGKYGIIARELADEVAEVMKRYSD